LLASVPCKFVEFHASIIADRRHRGNGEENGRTPNPSWFVINPCGPYNSDPVLPGRSKCLV
jgi:hypothetical protein